MVRIRARSTGCQRRSPRLGDSVRRLRARNDLRWAIGAMPGNWMRETGTLAIPTSLTYRVRFGIGCLRGAKATGLLTGWPFSGRELESCSREATLATARPARHALSVARAGPTPRVRPLANPCGYWRKRKNPGGVASRGSALTGRCASFAPEIKAPRTQPSS